MERQLTFDARNKLLTHTNVWSPDGQWIAYDTRSDEAGSSFDGSTIEAVNVHTGEQRVLYDVNAAGADGAHVGVVTWHPTQPMVAFIHGPTHPTPHWRYGPAHRQGVKVLMSQPGVAHAIDARDLTASTPGALRGGSHVHVWHDRLPLMSFTYDDELLPRYRRVALALTDRNVLVPGDSGFIDGQPRNHPGHAFTVLATRGVAQPRPGSDEYSRAFEECFVPAAPGQPERLAFVGQVRAADGRPVNEVFALDLPADLAELTRQPSQGLLQGSATELPTPPDCLTQTTRRLTRFAEQPGHPGVSVAEGTGGGGGVRHWLRGSPISGDVAFLAADKAGVVQLWRVAPSSGHPPQVLTHLPQGVSSAFNFLPDGSAIAHAAGQGAQTRLALTDAATGQTRWLEPENSAGQHGAGSTGRVLPYCICPSPDGRRLAYLRRVPHAEIGYCSQLYFIGID